MSETSQDDPSPERALAGVRVLDLVDGLGAYGPRMFVGLGAEVIRVEPPDGSMQRRRPPFLDPGTDNETSLYFLHYNAGKKSITLDLSSPTDRARLGDLLKEVDLVFDNGQLAGLGFDCEALIRNPRPLVIVSITPFGLDSARAHWKGDDLICQAMSGMINLAGYRNERPSRLGAEQASHMAGLAAALGALIGLYNARHAGKGEIVDIAAERAGALVPLQAANASMFYQFDFTRPRPQRPPQGRAGVFQASDGLLEIGSGRSLAPLIDVMKADPPNEEFRELSSRHSDDELTQHPQFRRALAEFVAVRARREVVELAQNRGVMCVPINDMRDLSGDEFLLERSFFSEVEVNGRILSDAGIPVRLSATPLRPGRQAPMAGADNLEILGASSDTET